MLRNLPFAWVDNRSFPLGEDVVQLVSPSGVWIAADLTGGRRMRVRCKRLLITYSDV